VVKATEKCNFAPEALSISIIRLRLFNRFTIFDKIIILVPIASLFAREL